MSRADLASAGWWLLAPSLSGVAGVFATEVSGMPVVGVVVALLAFGFLAYGAAVNTAVAVVEEVGR